MDEVPVEGTNHQRIQHCSWTHLSPSGSPGPRTGEGVAYDPATNRLILFGGDAAEGSCHLATNDAWVLTNANGSGGTPVWTALAPAGTPPAPRRRFAFQYDPGQKLAVVHGGDDPCGAPFGDAFVLAHADTRTRSAGTAATPPERRWRRGVYFIRVGAREFRSSRPVILVR